MSFFKKLIDSNAFSRVHFRTEKYFSSTVSILKKLSPLSLKGDKYVPSLNSETRCFTYWEGSHAPVGILLLHLHLSLSSTFLQPISEPFAAF